jgi:toxin ParE1/3/4
MPNNYTISNRAGEDIRAITIRSLVDFGEQQTNQYMSGMKDTLEFLAINPAIGRKFTHHKTQIEYLYHRYVSHVVYYRRREKDILIVRIFHTKMLPEKHL